MVRHIRTDVSDSAPYGEEQDSCAVYLSARKRGESTFGTLKRALRAVVNMGHRTGFVNGEGDGAGVQTDIPRRLWAKKLSQLGLRSSIVTSPGFWVGHLLIAHDADPVEVGNAIQHQFAEAGLGLLVGQPGMVRPEALSRSGRAAPHFWQLAGHSDAPDLEKRLFRIHLQLERTLPVHVSSLSCYTVVYKVRGSVETLPRYYPDLQDRDYDTAIALCHARYSTNTVSNFERAQPFTILGHNGEINTISRFRQEAVQVQVELPVGGSDSQDVDRAMHTLCVDYGLDLIEAMEMVFPPVPHELDLLPAQQRAVYTQMRQAFGPYAQGPAAVIARYGDIAVFSVDALGLRPLWFAETEKEYVISSERGAIPMEDMVADARPLSPGEKLAMRMNRGTGIDILTHPQIRQHVTNRARRRKSSSAVAPLLVDWGGNGGEPAAAAPAGDGGAGGVQVATSFKTRVQAAHGFQALSVINPRPERTPWHRPDGRYELSGAVLAALGWQRDHVNEIEDICELGKDPVGSLGFDGPLAVLSKNRVNLADYFKETVAVVTNPAVDRDREGEAFSTEVLVGARPEIGREPERGDLQVDSSTPLLPGGHPALGGQEIAEEVAGQLGSLSIEKLLAVFDGRVAWLTLGLIGDETPQAALDRMAREAIAAVRGGAQCVLVDDSETILKGLGWLDPHLAVGRIDEALRNEKDAPNLRRRAGIVVRSGSVRTLHDLALLVGFGADAINPYAMLFQSLGGKPAQTEEELVGRQVGLLGVLRKGLEKVTSTMGCHELRGYGRVCSSIGLAPSVAEILRTPNFLGSEQVGLTWARLADEAAARAGELRGEGAKSRLAHVDRFYPKFWKKVESFAQGEIDYKEVKAHFDKLSAETPVALRHVVGIRQDVEPTDPTLHSSEVDISIDGYDMPLVIGAMSFGSQGELSYRSYAHAASTLNIMCINGEGGELPEIMGLYKHNRGQQVASARFGVNAEFLNSAAVIEIKIGQGAKPGEGGMLPAYKVTPRVAAARHTNPYVPLVSPSNNHDLYSIEDLAQLIEELKAVNPDAKISVKCPVVPNIGLIAVGVAKAGADIISLSGYDGGTGAARRHALQYVGLPAEVGVIQAHRALTDAGIRNKVELWCDGGMKTGEDAVKMILLGANRVGFATMAMVAIGCTICRKCEDGTCHVGITTHIRTVDEAKEKGLKSFSPRVYDHCVEGIVRVFNGIADEMREIAARLGVSRLQDVVGHADLLEQIRLQDQIDLSPMFDRLPVPPRTEQAPGIGRLLTRPRNNLTRLIGGLVMETVEGGENEVTYQDEVMAFDRALGAHLAGEMIRQGGLRQQVDHLHLRFGPSSVAGNGFASWISDKMDILIEGGAQDGVAKGANGGRVAVMKGLNHEGLRIDGSVGKSFAYGAQRGVLIVQGDADSRACIRLSGADVILGGEIAAPLDEGPGSLGVRSNIKGFACEYMTSGRVVILGDPGPFAFAGMTGGVVYQQLNPEMGLDLEALKLRLARGAEVEIRPLEAADVPEVQILLGHYIDALHETHQSEVSAHILSLCAEWTLVNRFVKIVPKNVYKPPVMVAPEAAVVPAVGL